MKSLNIRIKQVRGDMSREDFSRIVGISPRALITYELNERTPKADVLNRICAERKVSPAWLLMGAGPMYAVGNELPSEASDGENGRHVSHSKSQQHEIIEYKKKEMTDASAIVKQREENAELHKELRDLLRQNGDLRVENAELRARVRDLERELREALTPEKGQTPLASAG